MNNNLKLIIDGSIVGSLSCKTIPRINETFILNEVQYKVDDVVYQISIANNVTKTFHTDEVKIFLRSIYWHPSNTRICFTVFRYKSKADYWNSLFLKLIVFNKK